MSIISKRKMNNFKICSLFVAVFSMQFAISVCDPDLCPDSTATFTEVIDQTVDDPNYVIGDPEMKFFKEIMGFRDNDIQHAFDDAIQFFNETYGLDFSLSPPNAQNEYFFENAKMRVFQFREDIHYPVVLNNWVQTGNTHTSCRAVHNGGFNVTFSGNQFLHGSYGGTDGIAVGVGNSLNYGYTRLDACDQSPITIQFQTATPFRQEPVDGAIFLNFDVYNSVLGYGKAQGSLTIKPDWNNPGKFRVAARNVFTFIPKCII